MSTATSRAADMDALLADSIVAVREFTGLTPYVKRADGNWYGPFMPQGRGMTSSELADTSGWLKIVHVGDRPILAGLIQIEKVRVMADYHGWRREEIFAGLVKLDQNRTYVDVRFSEKTGRLTRPPEIYCAGDVPFAPSTRKLENVLQWLEERGEVDTDDETAPS